MTRVGGRRAGAAVGNALLNVAALGGIVCIVLVALSGLFGISLIMFKTGSMSPGIPAGSLAVVREIPARAITVGDVVTVDRAGTLPVTHRVTSVSGEGASRTITMRGDANDVDDPAPYVVSEVRQVLAAVPGLAHVVMWFSHPAVLGALTIASAALVTWAFWPREPRGPREPQSREPLRQRGRHTAGAVVLVALCLGAAWGVGAPGSAPAAAASLRSDPALVAGERRAVTQGATLRLTSLGDAAAMRAMRPGIPVDWQVGVAFTAAAPGDVDVALLATGDPELGLEVGVRSCTVPWVNGACPGTERAVLPAGPLDLSGAAIQLGTLHDRGERWFLVTGAIPAGGAGLVELAVRAVGQEETAEVGPGQGGMWEASPASPELPVTGGSAGWVLALGAVVAGLGCAGLATAARGRLAR
ncbi:signal peptidase I [Leucobacter chromiireducens]|uniref:signal peptidase I n=1 Tax=Leucobacter chromiireducens TaxID=283877 RepID=UPI001F14A7E7|nr:signal peptidase I [Leucobacter chromiireducens]